MNLSLKQNIEYLIKYQNKNYAQENKLMSYLAKQKKLAEDSFQWIKT